MKAVFKPLAGLVAILVAGCAQKPSQNVPAKSYPLNGQVMMDGQLRVLPTIMAIRNTRFQIDNAFRVRQDGDYLGICMSYIYRGPEALWEQARRDYPGTTALVVTPPASENVQPISIRLDAAPGYRLIPGVRMGIAELKTMSMACVTTELRWSPLYGEKAATFTVVGL